MKMRKLNKYLVVIVILILISFIFACFRKENEKGSKITIGFAAMNVEMTWMKLAYQTMRKKADELGIELITYDANNNVTKQAINIEDLINRGVDAIITDPVDVKGLIPALEFAHSKGIPVVTFDRSAPGAPFLFFVGSDDVEAGRLACQFLAEGLDGAGKIIILEGAIGSSPAINRLEGFYNEIEKYPNMEVIFRKSGGFLRENGYKIMEEVLATIKDFDAIYSQNDDMILGALEAMKNAGITPDKVLTIGTDAIPEALIAIREGQLDATIQYPISQAEIALEKLVHYLGSGNLPEWKEYLIKPWIITKENISTGDFYFLIQDIKDN